MSTQTIGTPPPPERLTDYMRTRLCGEWAALEAERLKLQKAASDKKKRQDQIERDLVAQLKLDGESICDLKKWQFGLELKPGSAAWKAWLIAEAGEERVEELVAAVPKKEDFFLRAKEPAANPAGRRKKAA